MCHLHLFKTAASDERELERLEISEESVTALLEEEVAGRKGIVKIAGADVGGRKKELNLEEGGQTVWLLHVADSAEAQEWAATLRSAVLAQRYVSLTIRSLCLKI